jgi:hypothetical protein
MVPRTTISAQGTASGSHTLIATATSPRDWGSVEVVLDNGKVVDVPLSEKFWTTCAELRSSTIGRRMQKKGVAPWASDKPPQFDLELIGTGGLTWRRIGSEPSRNIQYL